MKTQILLALAFVFAWLTATADTEPSSRLVFPLLRVEYQTNAIVTADYEHPVASGHFLTNLLSNTNLFSPRETNLLFRVETKYRGVATNAGPQGSSFEGMKTCTWSNEVGERSILVARFRYTNGDEDEIWQVLPGNIIVHFRDANNDGYDAVIVNNLLVAFQQYKRGALHGLYVCVRDANNPQDREHCGLWTRFDHGLVVGKFLIWGGADQRITSEAEFIRPFDLLTHASTKLDLSWKDASRKVH
ncbi:MAG TPA: hypothetical protein VHB20_03960 [Verrucomicrobiae bacterium]|nr:hypothetical protein [Verrucomicrobiae bacterium]